MRCLSVSILSCFRLFMDFIRLMKFQPVDGGIFGFSPTLAFKRVFLPSVTSHSSPDLVDIGYRGLSHL